MQRVTKIPSFSIRAKLAEIEARGRKSMQPESQPMPIVEEMPMEDLPVDVNGVRICWKRFAAALPREHSALAGRLTNMRPSLSDDLVISVTINNRMVESDLQQMRPHMEQYLRKQLQNSKLRINIVVDETMETHHIYSRVEQYQILAKRYPVLGRLKDALDLDLR